MAGQKGLGTLVPGCNISLPSDQGRARVPSLTINPPASPSCTRVLPSPGPFGRTLGRGPNPRPPSKNLTDPPQVCVRAPSRGEGESPCAAAAGEPSKAALTAGRARSSPFRGPGRRDSARFTRRPRSPRSPGPRGARAGFRLPLSAAGRTAGSGRRSPRRAGAGAASPAHPRMLAGPRERGPPGRGSPGWCRDSCALRPRPPREAGEPPGKVGGGGAGRARSRGRRAPAAPRPLGPRRPRGS